MKLKNSTNKKYLRHGSVNSLRNEVSISLKGLSSAYCALDMSAISQTRETFQYITKDKDIQASVVHRKLIMRL